MAFPIPEDLFNRLRARQREVSIPPEVATFGDAVWLHADVGSTSYLLRDGRVVLYDEFELDAPPPRFESDDGAVSHLVCASMNLACPEILDSLPGRPPGAADCSQCGATRWWAVPWFGLDPENFLIICPKCAGRGWTD